MAGKHGDTSKLWRRDQAKNYNIFNALQNFTQFCDTLQYLTAFDSSERKTQWPCPFGAPMGLQQADLKDPHDSLSRKMIRRRSKELCRTSPYPL
jgi:hypothetical protein